MAILSYDFLTALLAIVIIDLVLAGDNAIVIALAARTLPKHLQRKAILWGTFGAIAVRILMTVVVVALLKIPGLRLIGGVLLIWIAYKLLAAEDHDESALVDGQTMSKATLWSALRTIVIADAVMGLDNVLGVAGAAKGSYLLVVLGLAISIPIMVWGSTLVLKLVDRFPIIIYIGAAVLAWTAATMINHEPLIEAALESRPALRIALYAALMIVILGGGYLAKRRERQARHDAADGSD